jgi:cell division protein FtsZ
MYNQQPLPFTEKKDEYAPTLKNSVEDFTPEPLGFTSEIIIDEQKSKPVVFNLQTPEIKAEEKLSEAEENEIKEEELPILNILYEEKAVEEKKEQPSFLNKPSTIYAQQNEAPVVQIKKAVPDGRQEESKKDVSADKLEQPKILFEEEPMELELVIKEEVETKPQAAAVFNLPMNDEEEEQKRRAEERIHKLRNLSYNMNTMDTGGEFENVPAYVRRNLELFGNNKLTTVEDFYSKTVVKKDENNQTQISTINTFLDGKKPD